MTASISHAPQQPLDFPGPFQPRLDNYFGGDNGALLQLLQEQSKQPHGWHYLRGQAACGKTHLLWAVQAQAFSHGLQVLYLQLGQDGQQLGMLQQLEGFDLVLLDNAEQLLTATAWQQPLFDCLQRAQMHQVALMMAGRVAVAGMTGLLPDLQSRLAVMSQHRVLALPDSDREEFARAYLCRHGIPIDGDVLAYLLSRARREQALLLNLLQRLCQRVLVSGQRPTRPMLRELLATGEN